jgi:molybdopterin converting factor small subunit
MQIHIRVSPGLAAEIGQPRLTLTVDEDATTVAVLETLRTAYPGSAALLARAVIMSAGRHVPSDEPLRPGQELALLIPIAGGAHSSGRAASMSAATATSDI